MERLDLFIQKITGIEGGKCVDTGGLTNLGISQRAYPDEDIENMTEERARLLFVRDYYYPLCINEINCPYTAFQILAFGINAGVSRCKKHVFELYGRFAQKGESAATVINRLQAQDRDGFFAKMLESFVHYYFSLAKANPEKYGEYIEGWINRLCRGINL